MYSICFIWVNYIKIYKWVYKLWLLGICDYNSNIKGDGVKTNLILYSAAVLLLVLGIWFNKLASTTNKNLKEAGLLEKPKKFDFDESNVNINGENLIQKINKDVEELNNATVKNIF